MSFPSNQNIASGFTLFQTRWEKITFRVILSFFQFFDEIETFVLVNFRKNASETSQKLSLAVGGLF